MPPFTRKGESGSRRWRRARSRIASPEAHTLIIAGDAPIVALALSPAVIGEAGESTTVTATLVQPLTEDLLLTVSATPVLPAIADDFSFGENRVLRIAAVELGEHRQRDHHHAGQCAGVSAEDGAGCGRGSPAAPA